MRIRTIKPEWLDDEKMALASPAARVASIALILLADDHGRGRGYEDILISRIFPGDAWNIAERVHMGQAALAELCQIGFLRFYRVRGQRYFEIVNWAKHQRVDKPGKPRIPMPSDRGAIYERANFETRETPGKIRETSEKVRETSEKVREAPGKIRETLATDLGPGTKDLDQYHGHTPPLPPSQASDPDRSPGSEDRDDQDDEPLDLTTFKRWRKAWGIRQEDIARALHCKRTQYSEWERGKDECPAHIRVQLAQYRKRIERQNADQRLELATAAVHWLNSKTGAHYQATSDQAQGAARQWLKWGWTKRRLIHALERASAGIDKQWWRPQTLFQADRLIRADEDNQARAPIARFGEQASKRDVAVGHAEPSHPDEFVGGTRDLGPLMEKIKRGEPL